MKNKVKIILIIFLTMFLSITGTALAQTLIKSSEVTYDNSKSKGSFDNVQDSLDELYQKAGYTGEEYHEEILHGADPVLNGELIPVYLADNGDVYYANTHTSWYSYEYKKWANAVILVNDAYAKNRKDNKDKYSVGDKISEEDIESYFVWIPRYAYKLWDIDSQTGIIDASTLNNKDYASSPSHLMENDRIIELIFGTKSYLDNLGYKSLIKNPGTGEFTEPVDLAINDYLEHPAFTLGTEELNGFWMGKFETGYNQTNTGESDITGTENWTAENARVTNGDSSRVVVKPNVFSWRNINVLNIFNTSKEYKTDLKSHMLKNTEWGAVAYLSHSVYGKAGEININNASDFKTGYSASFETNQSSYYGESGPSTGLLNEMYDTPIGHLASTTGNITGVYDMAGGVWEYVAGAKISIKNEDASGFTPEHVTAEMKAGYIDVYPADSGIDTFDKRILGDATGELAPFYKYYEKNLAQHYHSSFYSDCSYFVADSVSWFYRGGDEHHGSLAGIFTFNRHDGAAASERGFRLALAP